MTEAIRDGSFFVTHIGKVTVNERGTVEFTANISTPVGLVVREGQEAKVIVHASTIYELSRGVRDVLKAVKRGPSSTVLFPESPPESHDG